MNTNYLLLAVILFVGFYLWPKKTTSTHLDTKESDDDDEQIFINPINKPNDTRN